MSPEKLRQLLEAVKAGSVSVGQAAQKLRTLPVEDIGFARVDHHRVLRQGFPEVVFGAGKTVHQIVEIVRRILKGHSDTNLLITRCTDPAVFRRIKRFSPQAEFHKDAGVIRVLRDRCRYGVGKIVVVTAGTSDIPIAEEAVLTATAMGNEVQTIYDAGVAGIHRLLQETESLTSATVLVVVAGMEGALPSVVGGLVSVPVIAVPTSVGYGVSLNGLAALLAMLNSCAANVTVVNINNGFGAGYVASLINRRRPIEETP
ncbi:MAG: nickel pincer cofactor biosynthesis protein LarB [Acidobacteria bacterium]|nr:nickel pincer cofactor biosynthesis protein LarB [Acidobacteriota bacterium]MBI3655421.1 nickel pincer cofactor biosynthesis protein LarB [Acidobacteriota bacterium]